MQLILKFQTPAGRITKRDPVQEAYKSSNVNWDDVEAQYNSFLAGSPEYGKLNQQIAKDTLAYIDLLLRMKGIGELQRNAILAQAVVETNGKPSSTSPSGKYYGLFQWDAKRLPITKRFRGLKGLDYQIKKINDEIHDLSTWSDGGAGSGFKTAKDAATAFVSPKGRAIPAKYNTLNSDLNVVTWALTTGYVRPHRKKDEVQMRATVAKRIGLSRTNFRKKNGGK